MTDVKTTAVESPWAAVWKWFKKYGATSVVVLWASISTVLIIHNTSSISNAGVARDRILCIADNATRSIASQILATGASGTDPAAVRWQTLQVRLAGDLTAIAC